MVRKRHERINALAKLNGAQRYLEIGVQKGETFLEVDVPYKVAVDPEFRLDTRKAGNANTIFHEETSDEFFAKHAAKHGKFDLFYLDGLHIFEQTFRDFCASLGSSNDRTLWLIDDTHPPTMAAAERDTADVRKLRKIAGGTKPAWMGDVYKVVFAIHDFFPQLSYATFPGHGQTAIWRQTRKAFKPRWNSMEAISRARYQEYLIARDEIMCVRKPETILATIEKALAEESPR